MTRLLMPCAVKPREDNLAFADQFVDAALQFAFFLFASAQPHGEVGAGQFVTLGAERDGHEVVAPADDLGEKGAARFRDHDPDRILAGSKRLPNSRWAPSFEMLRTTHCFDAPPSAISAPQMTSLRTLWRRSSIESSQSSAELYAYRRRVKGYCGQNAVLT